MSIYNDLTIFVAIVAFNEVDLVDTIENCLQQAEYPERIHFGVVTHYHQMDKPILDYKNLKEISIDYPALLGVGPMRSLAVSLYDQENFFMQLDAHMKFDKHWDSYIVNMYHQVQKDGVESPLFTTYVPWWSVNEDGSINRYSEDNLTYSSFLAFNPDEINRVIPQQLTHWVDWDNLGRDYFEHCGLSAHFIFTKGSFVYDVAPDTDYMFYGEEPTTAIRAWTRGYRMFCTKMPVVWHKNKDLTQGVLNEKDRMLFDGSNDLLRQHHINKNRLGEKKAQMVMTGELFGYWGAPDAQALYEYQQASDFDFIYFYSLNMEHRLNSKLDQSDVLGYNMLIPRESENDDI